MILQTPAGRPPGQLWHQPPGHDQIPEVQHSVCPTQMPVVNPSCHLCFWPTGHKSEVPIAPTLGSINLPEWPQKLTSLKKTGRCSEVRKYCMLLENNVIGECDFFFWSSIYVLFNFSLWRFSDIHKYGENNIVSASTTVYTVATSL